MNILLLLFIFSSSSTTLSICIWNEGEEKKKPEVTLRKRKINDEKAQFGTNEKRPLDLFINIFVYLHHLEIWSYAYTLLTCLIFKTDIGERKEWEGEREKECRSFLVSFNRSSTASIHLEESSAKQTERVAVLRMHVCVSI